MSRATGRVRVERALLQLVEEHGAPNRFTTAEVARLEGVTEASVRRWAGFCPFNIAREGAGWLLVEREVEHSYPPKGYFHVTEIPAETLERAREAMAGTEAAHA
jgi:hypothetical protein